MYNKNTSILNKKKDFWLLLFIAELFHNSNILLSHTFVEWMLLHEKHQPLDLFCINRIFIHLKLNIHSRSPLNLIMRYSETIISKKILLVNWMLPHSHSTNTFVQYVFWIFFIRHQIWIQHTYTELIVYANASLFKRNLFKRKYVEIWSLKKLRLH